MDATTSSTTSPSSTKQVHNDEKSDRRILGRRMVTITNYNRIIPPSPLPAAMDTTTSTTIPFSAEPPRNDDKSDRRLIGRRCIQLWYRRSIQPFWKVTVAQVLCVIYILILTFSKPPVGIRDPITNDIVDANSLENTNGGVIYLNGSHRPVVAIGNWQKACLAISRASAFSMYPMLVVVFLTKMKATQCFLSRTPLSMYLTILNQAHEHHAHAGAYLAFDVWVHTLFHTLRWLSQGNLSLLWTSAAGLSGLFAVIATPLIAFPMMYCRDRLSYEVRKGLHYLFYLFAVVLCFHVPTNAVPNGGYMAYVLGSCIALYALDACYVYFFMCEKIETTAFYVLSSGLRLSMMGVSDRFRGSAAARGGYAYVNIPWINNKQWHPFSLFGDPHDPSMMQVFLLKNGDWTNAVHKSLSRDTVRPCWIKGPFPSPFSQASSYDNQILVATGVGITPALATISAFKTSRRINLIWAVRDAEMLQFFLEHLYLEHDGWNLIFYTGKAPLTSAIERDNTNFRVIHGRPNLSSIIPNMIYGIESKVGLPEKYTTGSKENAKKLLIERTFELDADESLSLAEKFARLCQSGMDHGFSMHDMINEIDDALPDRQIASLSQMGMDLGSCMHDVNDEMDDAHSETCIENDQSSTVEPYFDMTLPHTSVHRRRRSSRIGSITGHARERLSLTRWDSLKKVVHSKERLSQVLWNDMKRGVRERRHSTLLEPLFSPWRENKKQESFVKELDSHIMSTWGIFYCGGSQPVISDLREISLDFNVDLHIDSFAW